MARILAIDYGGKRTGVAVTDPLQIIATGLSTIESRELIPYLKKYFLTEEVELTCPKTGMIVIHMVPPWQKLLSKNCKSLFRTYRLKLWTNVTLLKWQKTPCFKWE
jgi:hypothetical protein